VLLGVSTVAVEVVRARLEGSDTLRASLEGAVSSQLGVAVEAGDLEVSFWPAQVRLAEPALILPARGRLTLGEASITVELASLLKGNARLLALQIAGPARISTRRLELAGELRVVLEPAEPPLAWSLQAQGADASGGSFSVRGGLSSGGGFEGTVELTEIESEPFASFLTSAAGERPKLAGRYSGTLELSREGGGVATLTLASPEAFLDVPPVRLEGPIVLVAELPLAEASDEVGGRLRIDATRARVDYAGGPATGSGRGGSLGGRILREPGGGFRLEEVGLTIRRFQGEFERRTERADGR
jgi:hypothetical protein